MSATRPSRAVLDASVVVRASVDRDETALDWLRLASERTVEASWPDLLVVEVASAVARLVRAGALTERQAAGIVAAVSTAPVECVPLSHLALPALSLALARDLTVYDACYAALAELLDAPLVTADRRLAAATPSSVLLG